MNQLFDKQFEQMNENSAYWHDKSCHLCESSKILWNSWSQGDILDSGDTYRMLMGMSFELLFKSFLVAEKIEIKPTHNLNELAELAGFERDGKEVKIFTNLTGFIYWEGKYPVPKPINTSKRKVTGGEGLKEQREPSLDSDDLTYENLLNIWQKFNTIYVNRYIAT